MNPIPFAALKLGGLRTSVSPIKYGKSRISGSQKMNYFMHSKAGSMPGQQSLFTLNEKSKPTLNMTIKDNPIISCFKNKDRKSSYSKYIDVANILGLKVVSFDSYDPYDDETYNVSVKEAYRQIYGNFHAMESERPIELERRLRNGDITIREFVRNLAKSNFYKRHYFLAVNQQRSIELNFKHILGRPPLSQKEIIKHIKLLKENGFDHHIDHLIDSNEYQECFGENTIPYKRCWNSPLGVNTNSFINSIKLYQSFASSDNALNSPTKTNEFISGKSLLLNNLYSSE
tara:strand:+ start:528 stop:1388 length:861 start_codon:yes stop_codon:yes gene_type:complete